MSNAKHVVENLSAYLDNELSGAERARVEAHLGACAQCQRELESLRYTLRMVQALPTMRAPRSFTLSDEQAARARPAGWFVLALRAVTALSALLLIVVVSADLFVLNPGNAASRPAQAPNAAMAAPTQARDADASNADTTQSKAVSTTTAAASGAFESRTAATALPSAPQPTTQVAPPIAPTKPTAVVSTAGVSASPTPTTTAASLPTAAATNTPLPTATAAATATRAPAPTAAPTPLPPPAPDRALPLRLIEVGLFGMFALGIGALIVLRATAR